MLTPKGGQKVASLNGHRILPAICDAFVLLEFVTESRIKLHASALGETEYLANGV